MIKIVFEAENRRSVAYDGKKVIGCCTYLPDNGNWLLNHTEVNSAYGGQGIGGQLVASVVEAARQAGVKIVPLCSFVKREFSQNTEYRDLLVE